MPYVYPPAKATAVAGTGVTADMILTADGETIQQKLDELGNEVELLNRDKLILEFIEEE